MSPNIADNQDFAVLCTHFYHWTYLHNLSSKRAIVALRMRLLHLKV